MPLHRLCTARAPLPALVVIPVFSALLLAACSTPAPLAEGPAQKTPDVLKADYDRSIRSAAVKEPGFSVPLRAIPAGQKMVTVGTFTEWGAPPNPLKRDVWVSLPDQLRELCRGKPDAVLALQQILGLPPQPAPSKPENRFVVVTFEVPRDAMFRPCPGGTDVGAAQCTAGDLSAKLDHETTTFLLNQIWTSYRTGFTQAGGDGEPQPRWGYPFTGMGWSYNWDPAASSRVGISEYVVRKGAPATVLEISTPEAFCGAA